MNELNEKLIIILYECNQHKKMILNAFSHIKENFPLNLEKYKKLTLDEIGHIDQFLFRFSKLQDSMGEKLFGTMLYLMGEDFSDKPFIDLLNRLEKIGMLEKDEWLNLRAIRNTVTHEYSINVQELTQSLNEIFKEHQKLIKIYDCFYKCCFERFEFVKNSKILPLNSNETSNYC